MSPPHYLRHKSRILRHKGVSANRLAQLAYRVNRITNRLLERYVECATTNCISSIYIHSMDATEEET